MKSDSSEFYMMRHGHGRRRGELVDLIRLLFSLEANRPDDVLFLDPVERNVPSVLCNPSRGREIFDGGTRRQGKKCPRSLSTYSVIPLKERRSSKGQQTSPTVFFLSL